MKDPAVIVGKLMLAAVSQDAFIKGAADPLADGIGDDAQYQQEGIENKGRDEGGLPSPQKQDCHLDDPWEKETRD